jgi:septal ring factor EnvC (AmiA/AmiB activator)
LLHTKERTFGANSGTILGLNFSLVCSKAGIYYGPKEIRMKELVMKQQQLEQEIMEREKSIKEILKAQESVEKELVTFKQAQKHIDEQLKIKSKGNSISIDSPAEV